MEVLVRARPLNSTYLECQRDLVSRLIMWITGATIRLIGVISMLPKSS